MGYSEGPHDSPSDTKDRLLRTGSKYQETPPGVADGDNVYFLVDSAGRIVTLAYGIAETGTPTVAADGAPVQVHLDKYGRQGTFLAVPNSQSLAAITQPNTVHTSSGYSVNTVSMGHLRKIDGNWDRWSMASDSGPGFGAGKTAGIGGDIALRASAAAGEANGTSTAVDDLGWVKSFHAVLDVTAVPTGGTPALNVYLQTQLANGDWQDIVSFTQAGGSTTKEMAAWSAAGGDGDIAGIGAEGAALTYDRFFANEDASLAATNIRVLPLGDSMRVKWVFAAGGSTGDYTFSVDISAHS